MDFIETFDVFYHSFFISLYSEDGFEQLPINAYVNKIQIRGNVYRNLNDPPIQSLNYGGAYVPVNEIFTLLGSKVEILDSYIEIEGEYTGILRIYYDDLENVRISRYEKDEEKFESIGFTKNALALIQDEYFIGIGHVRWLIHGAIDQDETKVVLYTPDFERLDIPATLAECYEMLDNELSFIDRNLIRITPRFLLYNYHMTLGLGIRNDWIYPTEKRIYGEFLKRGMSHPDDVSMVIIFGYHYYLLGIPKNIDELIMQDRKTMLLIILLFYRLESISKKSEK